MAYLALLQPDALAAARLSTALQSRHALVQAESWQELGEVLRRGGIDGVVVDADHPDRRRAVRWIGRIRTQYPDLAIVAYANFRQEQELYRFGGLGVDGVLVASRSHEDGSTSVAVDRAVAAARASRVAARVKDAHGTFGSKAVAWAIEHAPDHPSPREMAEALGHTTHTLASELRAAGLPPAGRLMLWGRLLMAGAYMGTDRHTVEEAAYMVGYATANSLSRAMKSETGVPPAEAARRGGLSFVHRALFPCSSTKARGLKGLVLAVLLAAQAGCASLGMGGGSVDRGAVDRVLDTPPVHQVHFGVLAVDAEDGRVLYSRNAHRKFIPASNQKVLVTSTALSLLGPDFTFKTDLWAAGTVQAGTLDGDLVLLGRGDPTLSDRYWTSGEGALRALADSLHATGLRRVTGALVVDATAWDSTTVASTWMDGNLPYRSSATGGVFALDEGELRVMVTGGAAPGDPVAVSWTPLGSPDYVVPALVTAPADSSTRVRPGYHPESRRVELTGRVAAGTTDTLSFALRDPVREATATLARVLDEAGIEVVGGWSVAWEEGTLLGGGCRSGSVRICAGSVRLAGLTSPPLAQIVQDILEPSQNWMTEQTVRALGHELGEGGSWAAGLEVVQDFLVNTVGVDSLDVAPRDGSGLSAYNLVTPRAMVAILRHMAAGAHGDLYRHALAEPGEEGSTLSRRLEGMEGRVYAKTGTISNVNSLSGYLVREDGRQVVFSILSNGSGLPSGQVRAAIDDVVRILAR